MLVFVLLCCVLRFQQTDASAHFDVSPTTLELDTSYLTVNCTFTYNPSSDISHLVSMTLSKSKDASNNSFSEIVSINTFDPTVVNVDSVVNSTVSGHIDNSGVSYLALHWTNPTLKEAGLYRCTVNGLDARGHPTDVSYTAQVTFSKLDVDQLIQIVQNQQQELKQVEKTLAAIGDTLNKLVASVGEIQANSEAFMKTVNGSIDNIMKRLLTSKDFGKPVEYNGKYYLISNSENTNASVSQQKCEELGGYLAEIDNSEENNFIRQLINTTLTVYSIQFVLLGGTNEVNVNQWIWRHSQNSLTFTDWQPGDPNIPDIQQCLFMFRVYSWQWVDDPCSTNSYFICEV